MRNAITDRDLLIEYFKYIQDQTRVYDSFGRSMNESRVQTVTLLDSYFETTREVLRQMHPSISRPDQREQPQRRTPRNEILESTANIVSDVSSNAVASLSDISSLIRALRENIRLLEEGRINRPLEPIPNMMFGTSREGRRVPPIVTFSTVTNERIVRGGREYNAVNMEENIQRTPTIPTTQRRYNNLPPNVDDLQENPLRNDNSIYQGLPYTTRNRSTTVFDSPLRRRPRSLVRGNITYFDTVDPLISPGNPDSPVRVRPSRVQIRIGTKLLTAMIDISGNNQTQCPIDLNDFVEGDSLLQILGCGHIFRDMNLRNHFRYSPTCPMCRYDIRDFEPSNINNDLTNNDLNDNTTRV